MAKYSRTDIDALSHRLETRADGVVNATPSFAGDLRAAAMLLRLMVMLADLQSIETSPNRCGLGDGRWPC